jgi:hypothetical protein
MAVDTSRKKSLINANSFQTLARTFSSKTIDKWYRVTSGDDCKRVALLAYAEATFLQYLLKTSFSYFGRSPISKWLFLKLYQWPFSSLGSLQPFHFNLSLVRRSLSIHSFPSCNVAFEEGVEYRLCLDSSTNLPVCRFHCAVIMIEAWKDNYRKREDWASYDEDVTSIEHYFLLLFIAAS